MSTLLRKLIRGFFLLWLALLVVSVLLLGVVAAILSTVWSLLRGRKPALFTTFMRFRQASSQFQDAMRRPYSANSGPYPPAGVGDVVDVQAKELPAQRITSDSHQP